MSRRNMGFTLVELLAALSVSGLVLLGGILLVDQVTDTSARIGRVGVVAARDANGWRVLRQLLADARVTADSLGRFRGDSRSFELTTLCQRPHGWLEQCRAALNIDWRADTSVVVAHLSTREDLELARWSGPRELRYLDALAADSTWLTRWALSIAMPVAISFVSPTDTSTFSLGVVR